MNNITEKQKQSEDDMEVEDRLLAGASESLAGSDSIDDLLLDDDEEQVRRVIKTMEKANISTDSDATITEGDESNLGLKDQLRQVNPKGVTPLVTFGTDETGPGIRNNPKVVVLENIVTEEPVTNETSGKSLQMVHDVEMVDVDAVEDTQAGTSKQGTPSSENSNSEIKKRRKRPGKRERKRMRANDSLESSSGAPDPESKRHKPPANASQEKKDQQALPKPPIEKEVVKNKTSEKSDPKCTGPPSKGTTVTREKNRSKNGEKTSDPKEVQKADVQQPSTSKQFAAAKPVPSSEGQVVKQNREKKKAKRKQPQFSEVVKNSLWTAVVVSERINRLFSFKQMEQLSIIIGKAVTKSVTEGGAPRMEGIGKSGGRFIVKCADSWTVDWLKRVVAENTLEEMKLEAIPADKLPRLTRCTVFLPNLPGESEISRAMALTHLGRQNPGLQTSEWTVFSDTKVKGGALFVLGVDAESLEVLKGVNFKPFYGIGKVSVRAEKTTTGKEGGEEDTKNAE